MPKQNSLQDQIQKHYFTASTLADTEVERLARKILIKRPDLNEFIMGMGSAFFTTKENDNHIRPEDDKDMAELDDFFGKWNEYLRLKGSPMRFTATGKKITAW